MPSFNGYGGWYIDDVQICIATVPDGASGIYIDNVSVLESNFANSEVTFTVTVDPPAETAFGLRYATADESATVADEDYEAVSGTLTFSPGESTKTITVDVPGDPFPEADETFRLELSDLTGGGESIVLATPYGVCTIEKQRSAVHGICR